MRPVVLPALSYVAGAVGAIAASQTPGAAGALTINGSLASGGVATTDNQRFIGITSTSNLSNRTFVLTGTDWAGRAISETLTGPNNTTVLSALNYKTVTGITISGSAAGALTVDTVSSTVTGAGPEVPVDRYLDPGYISAALVIAGTLNATVQYTLDDVFAGAPGQFSWFSFNGLTGLTASATNQTTGPISALRLLVNTGTGSGKLTVVQAGAVS